MTPSSLPSRGAVPHLPEGVTVNAPRNMTTANVADAPTPEVPEVMAWGATLDPAELSHKLADVVAIVTCECGKTFIGSSVDHSMARWAEHCDECEQ